MAPFTLKTTSRLHVPLVRDAAFLSQRVLECWVVLLPETGGCGIWTQADFRSHPSFVTSHTRDAGQSVNLVVGL